MDEERILYQTKFHRAAYAAHLKRWGGCRLCSLHHHRDKIVLFRGTLPCEVLFIGEAPGGDENEQGYPFIGRAGAVLEAALTSLNEELTELSLEPLKYGITNVVACYPGKDKQNKFNKPTNAHAATCRQRLEEMVELASPKLIVLLGNVPQEFCSKICGYRTVHVYHPSYILRRGGVGSAAYRSWWNEIAKEVVKIYAKVSKED